MLQIKGISKQYRTGDLVQQALSDVSLNLRDNEFVAILGPSGSGKTTLLNIIGGLDRYDSGDLVINGVSTKKYKDRDWDSYRNHSVGFVFQSYNLIPHQSVLQNVELALTIGGVSRRQRRKLALDALERVGLRDQAHKKPNQMSGGQMQRVAIARALVNNPDIVLADEPTGALDSTTSIQVMELLKEVAKDRLVVMVTHNPELADRYANRIVKLRDGRITDDSNPLRVETEEPAVHKNLGKSSMSIFTSFGLSLKNLLTKKGRTVLTAFAGSIGIIGIALILSLSTGFQNYINQIQEETMTSYPLTLTSETTDMTSIILSMWTEEGQEAGERELVEKQYISSVMSTLSDNDLKSFKTYLEEHPEEYEGGVSLIKYGYSVAPLIYTVDAAGNLAQLNPNDALNSVFAASNASMTQYSGMSMGSVFYELTDLGMTQEDNQLLAGRWPENYNELLVVLSDPHQISDLLLYSLGLRDTAEFKTMLTDIMTEGEVAEGDPITITYDDILNLELKLIDPTDKYAYNDKYDIYEDMFGDGEYIARVYAEAEPLRIVGVACPADRDSQTISGVLYLPSLTQHIMEQAADSDIVKKQMAAKSVDVFSGNRFDQEQENTGLDFQDMITVDEDMISDAFQVNLPVDGLLDADRMQQIVMASAQTVTVNLESTTQSMVDALAAVDRTVFTQLIQKYIDTFTLSSLLSGAMPTGQEPPAGEVPPAVDTDAALAEALPRLPDEDPATAAPSGESEPPAEPATPAEGEPPAEPKPAAAQEPPAESAASAEPEPAGAQEPPAAESAPADDAPLVESAPASEPAAPAEPEPAEPEPAEAQEPPAESAPADDAPPAESAPASEPAALAEPALPAEGEPAGETPSAPAESAPAEPTAAPTPGESPAESAGTSAPPETESHAPGTASPETPETGTLDPDRTPEAEPSAAQSMAGWGDLGDMEDMVLLKNPLTGENFTEQYKAMALNEEAIAAICGQMEGLEISPENLTKILSEAYDAYFADVFELEQVTSFLKGSVIPSDAMPDFAPYIEEALRDNDALIFQEGYGLAKRFSALLVAQGIGQAVGEITGPLGNMFSEDLFTIDQDKFAEAFSFDMDEDELSRLMETMLSGSDTSYGNNLLTLGYQDPDDPSTINFYFTDFESKGNFTDLLDRYNQDVGEERAISYTDLTGLLMGSVETIINSVTYVLVAFVSISLVVSSIMIGIITYISVLERTKEIGILRAIGASKHNVSSIFNAETFIIGLLSGLIGVGCSYLLNIPINLIIHHLTGNPDVTAVLPVPGAVALVIIATVLTMIGGLIPARSASKKDPVIALRTE